MQFKIPLQVATALSALVAAAPGASLKTALQAKYDSISGAFVHKDGTVFEHVYAPKYVLIGTSGHKTDRKQLLSDYQKLTQFSDISSSRALDTVTVSGSTATVTVRVKFRGVAVKPDGKHVFESNALDKDTWSRQNGSWMLLKTQVLSLDATYDKRRLMQKGS